MTASDDDGRGLREGDRCALLRDDAAWTTRMSSPKTAGRRRSRAIASIAALLLAAGIAADDIEDRQASAGEPPAAGGAQRGARNGAGTAERDASVRASRIPWTGSKFAGTPEPPPPYTVEPAFPHLKFEFPVVLVRAKGPNRLFLGELKGRIFSFPERPDCKKADLALDLAKLHPDLTAFYGLIFSSTIRQNRYVYVCYVLKNDVPDGSVVSRFTVSRTDPPVIDPGSEQVILKFWSGGHNGGCLDFGKDGYLYISTGDGAGPSPPDTKMTGQDCSDLLSSILRIDVDHPDAGKAYRDPAGQSVREPARSPARDLGVRLPQPLEDELRPRHAATCGSATSAGSCGS